MLGNVQYTEVSISSSDREGHSRSSLISAPRSADQMISYYLQSMWMPLTLRSFSPSLCWCTIKTSHCCVSWPYVRQRG